MKHFTLLSIFLLLASLLSPLPAISFFSGQPAAIEREDSNSNFMFQSSRSRSGFFETPAQASPNIARERNVHDRQKVKGGTTLPSYYFNDSYETSTCWLNRTVQICTNYYQDYKNQGG